MRTVLLGGASGFLGRKFTDSLAADGHRVVRLVRGEPSAGDAVAWDPEAGSVDVSALARVRPDVVVNLAGARIDKVWTDARRQRITASRVNATRGLAAALAGLTPRPAAFIIAGGSNYYGFRRGDESLDEDSAPGPGFLAGVAQACEAAARPAADAGIRVVRVRMGSIVGREAGVLGKLRLPFALGLGGPFGGGQQWMSWISRTDAVRAFRFLAEQSTLDGAVNVVSPEPVRNERFGKALGHALHRPAVIPLPAFALRMAFGQMAEETILADLRLTPKRLAGAGFEFQHPHIEEAIAFELRR
jgi:uncharacterized protein